MQAVSLYEQGGPDVPEVAYLPQVEAEPGQVSHKDAGSVSAPFSCTCQIGGVTGIAPFGLLIALAGQVELITGIRFVVYAALILIFIGLFTGYKHLVSWFLCKTIVSSCALMWLTQRVQNQRKGWRGLAPAGVIKVISRKKWAPFIQYPHEFSLLQIR